MKGNDPPLAMRDNYFPDYNLHSRQSQLGHRICVRFETLSVGYFITQWLGPVCNAALWCCIFILLELFGGLETFRIAF